MEEREGTEAAAIESVERTKQEAKIAGRGKVAAVRMKAAERGEEVIT